MCWPGTFSPSERDRDPDMHHGTCVTHVPWCMSGSLSGSFLWSRWWGICPIPWLWITWRVKEPGHHLPWHLSVRPAATPEQLTTPRVSNTMETLNGTAIWLWVGELLKQCFLGELYCYICMKYEIHWTLAQGQSICCCYDVKISFRNFNTLNVIKARPRKGHQNKFRL